MSADWIQYLVPMYPELFLLGATIMILMAGVYNEKPNAPSINMLAILSLTAVMGLLYLADGTPVTILNQMFISNGFTIFVKGLIMLGAALVLILSFEWLTLKQKTRFEFSILAMLSILGMMVLVSANDLMALYIGIELMSLPLYVMAAFDRDELKSTEAGLKYFVLGALASGMLLFGSSFIYGFAGSTSFDALTLLFGNLSDQGAGVSIGITFGLVMVMIGVFFKISAVPFHMWTPDVYEGAPTPVSAFFAVAPKIAALALFIRLLLEPFGELIDQWQQIVIVVSVATMFVGAFAALVQKSIKRLLAYSSIGHVGYALVGVASGTIDGVTGVLIYLSIYIAMSAGAWGCVLLMRRKDEYVENIEELAGLSRTRPQMALAMAVFMFSMAGIPPLAGFFGKFYIFIAAVDAGLIHLAVIGVLTSVVSAFYYLKIVKLMYFDEPKEPFDQEMRESMRLVLAICGVFTLLFFLFPSPLIINAKAAAEALLL